MRNACLNVVFLMFLSVLAGCATGSRDPQIAPDSAVGQTLSAPSGYVGTRNWWERLLGLGKWKDEVDVWVRSAPSGALAVNLTREEREGTAVRNSATKVFVQNGAEYRCGITTYGLGANFERVTGANPNLAVLYPGALVTAKTLHRGSPTPVDLPRRPITVSVWPHPGGPRGSSREVRDLSAAAVSDAVMDLLRTAGRTNVALVHFLRTEAHSSEQVAIKSGMSAEWMGASIGQNATRNESLELNTVVGVFDQVYYFARTAVPRHPSLLFQKVSTAELATVMDSTNPLGLVTDVAYGRRAFIRLTSRHSHSDILQAMSFAYGQSVGKDDPNVPKFSADREQQLRTV